MSWATSNGDLHAKNLSVVGWADCTVAPIFDIPSTVPYGDTAFAIPLAGRRDNLTAKAFRQFGEEIGVLGPEPRACLGEVVAATADLVEQMREGAAPFDARRRRGLVRVLERRRGDLGA